MIPLVERSLVLAVMTVDDEQWSAFAQGSSPLQLLFR
jgi:hypothetical protein